METVKSQVCTRCCIFFPNCSSSSFPRFYGSLSTLLLFPYFSIPVAEMFNSWSFRKSRKRKKGLHAVAGGLFVAVGLNPLCVPTGSPQGWLGACRTTGKQDFVLRTLLKVCSRLAPEEAASFLGLWALGATSPSFSVSSAQSVAVSAVADGRDSQFTPQPTQISGQKF